MKFTDEQIQELKQAFALFDMDGSGEVSTDELGTVLATLGQKVSDEELVEIIAEVDQDGGGSVDFDEFVAWFNRQGEEAQGKLFVVYYCDSAGDQVVYQNSCAPLVLPPFTRPASRSSRRSESWRSCKPKGALP